MSEQEILDYLLSTGLYEVTDEKRPYNDLFYEYRMIKTDKTVQSRNLLKGLLRLIRNTMESLGISNRYLPISI